MSYMRLYIVLTTNMAPQSKNFAPRSGLIYFTSPVAKKKTSIIWLGWGPYTYHSMTFHFIYDCGGGERGVKKIQPIKCYQPHWLIFATSNVSDAHCLEDYYAGGTNDLRLWNWSELIIKWWQWPSAKYKWRTKNRSTIWGFCFVFFLFLFFF